MQNNILLKSFLFGSLFFVCACFTIAPSQAQDKEEIEREVNIEEVPTVSIEWVESVFPDHKRITWYQETTFGKRSYEAKFKHEGHWISVEFSENGILEDVETRIRKKEVPEEPRQRIWSYFDTNYTNLGVNKIQLQWSGDPEKVAEAVSTDDPSQITVRYEIVFHGKEGGGEDQVWEGLFSKQGEFISRVRVILRPSDNMIY